MLPGLVLEVEALDQPPQDWQQATLLLVIMQQPAGQGKLSFFHLEALGPELELS